MVYMLKYQILRDYDDAIIHLKDKLGIRATTNTQLDTCGRQLFGKKYLGTFSADDYPKPDQMSERDMFIINNKTTVALANIGLGLQNTTDAVMLLIHFTGIFLVFLIYLLIMGGSLLVSNENSLTKKATAECSH